MALFTDGRISTLEQLSAQDSSILDVANTEGIDITVKLSLAQEELGVELTAALARSGSLATDPASWRAGNLTVDTNRLQLRNVAVTSPLRLWHTFHTLALVYRDAYNNQLNDRYLGRCKQYKELAEWASTMLYQTGIGAIADPVPIAEPAQLSILAGDITANTYYVQVSWLNARGEEGMPSKVASLATPDLSILQVRPVNQPANATGWNSYVGSSLDSITLQNASPIDPTQDWIEPASGLILGVLPRMGQEPNYFRQVPRILQRG